MIRIAICDDESRTADQVKKLATDFFREKNVEASIVCFSNGKELLKYDRNMDIIFLDIRMEGMDGMEAAGKLRHRGFKGVIIFITVLKEMVFRSFEVQAYDYLLKPIGKSSLQRRWSACLFP